MSQRLEAGQTAPLFSVVDVFDREINLSDYQKKGKKILVSFFRNVACPFCNFRIHQLTMKNDAWKDKLEMIFFLEAQKDVVLKSSFHRGVSPIPIIADFERKTYSEYGTEVSTEKFNATINSAKQMAIHAKLVEKGYEIDSKETQIHSIPADFLLDENLTIIKAHYGKDIPDHLPFEEIEQFISE
ncbi:redoxin domain-containing protein [Bernardetia sp.]|uniref:redoxin domain-containing protein n=1 Tax=Bernardetia sp. TaxID=1937974 RepID=UPI0025B8827B|nr:redoxin domain-containing protein [Bernardetia sp.]